MSHGRLATHATSHLGFAQDPERRKLFQRQLVHWFDKAGRALPWRSTRDPYAVMVSEMMLKQTQVTTVQPYYARWMQRFPTAEALAEAAEADVLHHWQGLGYYARARNLHKAARAIVSEHAGVFPRELDAIRALAGVGPYTAGAIAAFAFEAPVPAVDANIARVLARLLNLQLGIDTAAGRAAIWDAAALLVPKKNAWRFNSGLMELGALVCQPRTPACDKCPVAGFCAAENPAELPRKKARPAVVKLEETVAFEMRDGKVLLEQSSGPKWKGLWKLPAAENGTGKLLLALEYPYTKHRITLRVIQGKAGKPNGTERRWVSGIADLAMPSPHRRAVQRLLDEHACRSGGHPACR